MEAYIWAFSLCIFFFLMVHHMWRETLYYAVIGIIHFQVLQVI